MSQNVETIVRSAIEEIVERIGSAGVAPVFTLQPQSQSVESE